MAITIDNSEPTFLTSLPLARDALRCAREAHRGQLRDSDAAPFVLHPLEVGSLLHNTGHPDHVVAAGILHDSVEKGHVEMDELAGRFGSEVAALVGAVTEDPSITEYGPRKAALRGQVASFGPQATAVFAADKVAKVRELRAKAARDADVLDPDNEVASRRLRHYEESLLMLEAADPAHPLVRQLRFELEALRSMPPRPGTSDRRDTSAALR